MATTEMNPAKIIGIQFSVLSPEEIRKGSVAEITSRDTYINNKPVIGGLFDPRMGVLDPGLICPTDGLGYMQTPGYFGHIELARPVYYIQYLTTTLKILRCVCCKCSKLKISKEKHAHVLTMNHRDRWGYVFKHASKIKRCGEETEDGCGCRQPRKIIKEGLANLIAEWDNPDGIKEEGEEKAKDKLTMKLTPEMVLKIFRRISDEDVEFMGFSKIWSRPDWFICQVLAVPPPAVRPSVKHDSQQRSEDDISHIIVNIIKANKTLLAKIQLNASEKVIDDWTTVLQYYVATMVDNRIPGVAAVAQRSGRPLKSIKERLVGKQGRVRGNLMGKRVDFSGRSVITPDARLGIRDLGVPIKIAKNITFPNTVNKRNKTFLTKLVKNGPEVYPGANILERKTGESISLKYADRDSISINEGDVVHRHLLNGDPVLFNRQPTLHRMSMMCHIVKVMKEGNTFRMNVADTKPYNADFDGDEMNLHGPQDEESQAELLHLAAVPRNIISPQNNSSIIGIFQDSLLGCYRFTRDKLMFDNRHAMNLLMHFDNVNPELFKDVEGGVSNFEILSQILPPMSAKFANKQYSQEENKKTSNNIIEIRNGQYLRGQMDKGTLGSGSKGLIQSIFNDFNFTESADFIDNIQNVITEYLKLHGYSVGISDLIADNKTNQKIIEAVSEKKKEVQNLIDQLHLGIFENASGKSNEVEFETKVNNLLNDASSKAGKIGRTSLSSDNRFVIMVNAGSKGSPINIAQMISCLGQQNVDGKRIPYGFEDRTLPHYTKFNDTPEARGFVESSFIQGLTPEEVYFHAMGGRVGLIDTAVKTSQTGYIQRRLIKAQEDGKVHYDMTVRNNKGKILQFSYGDDNIDPIKVENQSVPLTRMNLEQIYAHFQIPEDSTKAVFTTTYTKDAAKRMRKQKKELNKRVSDIISQMIENREKLLKHVFKASDNIVLHIPVHFLRIMNNIQHQMNIQPNFVVDITPLETYSLIDKYFTDLHQSTYTQPTELFKIAWYYYLTPKELLMMRRFNRKALVVLFETLNMNYHKAVVHPGEMVGMVSAQSIGEPTTQMTLNTFHFAGVASKSNVTRGVPRIEEILSLSENPKMPSCTIYLKDEFQTNVEHAQEIKYSLEYTSIKDITKSVGICFDPKPDDTLIDEDHALIAQHIKFQQMICDAGADDNEKKDSNENSKWVIRIELEREAMMERNINMDDIHFAIKNVLKNNVDCIFSDLNDDNLVFRIRLINGKSSPLLSSKKKYLDQTDDIYMLKNLQENILNNIILKGIKGIPKIILRKVVNHMVPKDGNFVPEDIWVLDTVGSNLKQILSLDTVDANKTYSNNIQEVYRTLGIEAARQCIFNEINEAFEANGNYINYHHLALLCDRMCATKKMVSVFRHGINNDDIGPIAKASFEETPEMFLRAARHAELDLMTGVSSNIMCGQEGYYGTGSFQILLNINEVNKMASAQLEEKINIDEFLQVDKDDVCSKNNIVMNTSTEYISGKYSGDISTEYDPGF